MQYTARVITALVGLGFLALPGCSEGIKTVPVYGNISFTGRKAPKVCNIFFQPINVEGVSRPSTTKREPDGKYTVKAFERSKGLVPGTYRVKLFYYDLKPGANPGLDSSYRESTFDAGEIVVDANSNGVEHNIEVTPKPGKTAKK